jgi:hypothetical protein
VLSSDIKYQTILSWMSYATQEIDNRIDERLKIIGARG